MCTKNELGTSCETPSDANPERKSNERGDDDSPARLVIRAVGSHLDGIEGRLVAEAVRNHGRPR